MTAYLAAIGHYHPSNRITNQLFANLDIGSSAPWVEERTGILARHSVLTAEQITELRHQRLTVEQLRQEGQIETIAQMSLKAWGCLAERFGSDAAHQWLNQLDNLICGTSVPDFDIPANAGPIAAALGAQCSVFDVNSACSSFIVNLHMARSLIHSSDARSVGLFQPERYSLRLDYTDRSSCVLFGDGAAASIISAQPSGLEILDSCIFSDPAGHAAVTIPVGGCFHQVGQTVQKFAISKTIASSRHILLKNDLTPERVDFFIAHQANLRMVESAASRLGIPNENLLYNVDQFGNQGAAGAPCVLSQNWDRIPTGALVLVTVVGSGLTWGSALMRKI